MRTEFGDRILAVLARHSGREQAIPAPDICHELGWPEGRERLVRQIIASEAMLWPHIVCSVPGAGYFCATDFEEALTYRNWLADLRDQAQLKLETFEKLCAQHGLRVAPVKRRAA